MPQCAFRFAAVLCLLLAALPAASVSAQQSLEAYPRWNVRQGSPDDPDLSLRQPLAPHRPARLGSSAPSRLKPGETDFYGNPNDSTHAPDPTVDFRNDLRQDMRRDPGYREGVDSRYDPRQDSRFNGRSDPKPSGAPPGYGQRPSGNVFRGTGNRNLY